jgi:predicted enzyme related to lactoylglutathione lyase
MAEGLRTITYPVRDLAKAKALYGELLGVEPYMDQPYYVAFSAAGQDVGLDPQGHQKGMTAPIPYWHVADIQASLKTLLGAGAEIVQDPTDVGEGNLIATVKDADGNVTGLFQAA